MQPSCSRGAAEVQPRCRGALLPCHGRVDSEQRRHDADCRPVGAEGERGRAGVEDALPCIRASQPLSAEPLLGEGHIRRGVRRLHRREDARTAAAVPLAGLAHARQVARVDDLEVLAYRAQFMLLHGWLQQDFGPCKLQLFQWRHVGGQYEQSKDCSTVSMHPRSFLIV